MVTEFMVAECQLFGLKKATLSLYPIFTKQPYVLFISLRIKSRNVHNLNRYFGLGLVFGYRQHKASTDDLYLIQSATGTSS